MNKNGKSISKIINNNGNGHIQIIKKKLYRSAISIVELAIMEVILGGSFV